jgi:hypothetical protein
VRGQRFPGLAMSRALGDIAAANAAGVSFVPTVTKWNLGEGPKGQRGTTFSKILGITFIDWEFLLDISVK